MWTGRATRDDHAAVPGTEAQRRVRIMRLVNLLLALVMGAVVLDKHLEPRIENAAVQEAVQHKVSIRSRYQRGITYWVVLKMDNGRKFQTERMATAFPVGTVLQLRVGALLGGVKAYRMDRDIHRWVSVEAEKEEFKPMPYAVLLLSIVLLAPWWKLETRWVMQAIQLTILVAWALMLIGTGVLIPLS